MCRLFLYSRAGLWLGWEWTSVGRAEGCERRGAGAQRTRGGTRGADRGEPRVETGERARKEPARLEREKGLRRQLFESSPDLLKMVRQQLPREP